MAGQGNPTKISFVYSNPTDPAAFEAAYPDQLALARKLPGLIRLQASRVWPKEDGSPTPAYRLLDLYFDDYESASAAVEAALTRCRGYKPAPKAAAQCRSVGSFKNECYAVSFDPKEGTPGAGWAIAPTKELAEERAMAYCQVTAGEDRRDFCKIEESKCDGN